jgi:hypothetical protein
MRRGRGLARLIEGVSNGEPFALITVGVMVMVGIGWFVYKVKNGPRV